MFNLVEDAKMWKKWWSMRFIIFSAALQAVTLAYTALPYDWLPYIPSWVKVALAGTALTSAAAAGIARVVSQQGQRGDKGE